MCEVIRQYPILYDKSWKGYKSEMLKCGFFARWWSCKERLRNSPTSFLVFSLFQKLLAGELFKWRGNCISMLFLTIVAGELWKSTAIFKKQKYSEKIAKIGYLVESFPGLTCF